MGSAFLLSIIVLLFFLPWRDRALWIAATATRRRRWRAASPFWFALVFFNFPALFYSYFFFLSLEDESELYDDELEGLLLLLFFLSLSLRRSGQSFFLTIYTYIPVTFPAAQSALIIGLRSFRLLWLASNLHLHSGLIDILSVHFFNSLLNSFLPIKHLNDLNHTMKA